MRLEFMNEASHRGLAGSYATDRARDAGSYCTAKASGGPQLLSARALRRTRGILKKRAALVSALARMGFEMTTSEMIRGKRRIPRLGPPLFAWFWLGMTILVGSMMRGAHGET